MDFAGRPGGAPPHFQSSDAFAEGEDTVWAALQPVYLTEGHPGGRYAAFHVVEHRRGKR